MTRTAALFLVVTALRAQTVLAPNQKIERTLQRGATDSYLVQTTAGDIFSFEFGCENADVVVSIFNPAGVLQRAFSTGVDPGQSVTILADKGGAYRVTLSLRGDRAPGHYIIDQLEISSEAERTKALGETAPDKSPRIRALRADLKAGKSGALDAFWAEIAKSGAPLIEPIEKDSTNMLVTFLWRGNAETKSVFVPWAPDVFQRPGEFFMSRLESSDVWFKSIPLDRRLRTHYMLIPNMPACSTNCYVPAMGKFRRAAEQRDPLNPKIFSEEPNDPDPPLHRGRSLLEMPDAPVQSWVAKRSGVPQGKLEPHKLESAILKNSRSVTIYTPPGYTKDAPQYPAVYLFDESDYLGHPIPAPTILDNLIAAKRIPPVVAVLIGNAPDARGKELPCNPEFAEFLNAELVPWARRLYNITHEAGRTVVGGFSYGGLAAAYAGYRHSETFGNILSQSGSYWWTPPKAPGSPDPEPQWLIDQFIDSPRLPLRWYMDAGSEERELSGRGGSILLPNRNLRNVLRAKGYEVHYQQFYGAHDYASWQGTLADGLILLIGGAN